MKQLFKLKFKMHKLVNIIFYLIIFLIGFLIGLGVKKISFNNVLSRVLMIDNVEAYTIKTENRTYNEEFIVNELNKLSGFDINDFPYIMTLIKYGGRDYEIYAFDETAYDCFMNKTTKSSDTGFDTTRYLYKMTSDCPGGRVAQVYFSSGSYNPSFTKISNYGSSNFYVYPYQWKSAYKYYYFVTNFNLADGYGSQWNVNKLDFSSFKKLEYNENLFKDNPDFKEVCVNNYDTFSITSNEIQDYDENNSPMYHSFDFMWFPNGMKGISTWGYDSEEHDHVYIFEESENTFSGWWYWLDTKDEIDKYFGRDNPGLYLSSKGYKDKYSYYNWTFYPFEMTFTESYYRYQVFWFKDPYIEYLDGSKKDDSEQYCFYIKNEYDVNILNRNENGDYNSTITILGGIEKNDFTYKNELNNNSNGFFSNINNVISKLRPTISFINLNILNLYTSMPLIVRNFILAFLTLILIRIIIGMVIK